MEHSSDLLLIVDADARVTYCSPSVERLIGYSQDEVTGLIAYELIPDDDLAQLAALHPRASAATDPAPSTGTTRIRAKDGSLHWIEWTASSHLDDEAVRGILISARDVTDRVLSERRLSVSEQRYRLVTEASPDMIYLVGADGRVQFVNDRGARASACPPSSSSARRSRPCSRARPRPGSWRPSRTCWRPANPTRPNRRSSTPTASAG